MYPNQFDPYQVLMNQVQQPQSNPLHQMQQQMQPQNNQMQMAQRQQQMIKYFETERGKKLNSELEKDFEDWRQEQLGIHKPIDYSEQLAKQTEMIKALSEKLEALANKDKSEALIKNTPSSKKS